MTNDAQRVLAYFKQHYWPTQSRCNQHMAIQKTGRLPSTVVEAGLTELNSLGLVKPGGLGSFCLTDEGVRAIGAAP